MKHLTDEEILDVATQHCAFTGEGYYHLNKYTGWAIVQVVRECFELADLCRQAEVSAAHKLVPLEPTQDMLYAMAECDGYQRGDRDHPMLTRWEDYWRAALMALPDGVIASAGSKPQ